MKYKAIPETIEALRYDHSLDLSQFKGMIRHCVGTHGHAMTPNGEVEIKEGDYIILRGGHFELITAKDFNNRYIPV